MLAAGELLFLVAGGPEVVEAVVVEAEQIHIPYVLGVHAAARVPQPIEQPVEPGLLRRLTLVVRRELEFASFGRPVEPGQGAIARSRRHTSRGDREMLRRRNTWRNPLPVHLMAPGVGIGQPATWYPSVVPRTHCSNVHSRIGRRNHGK
jgi:hypothetical protein